MCDDETTGIINQEFAEEKEAKEKVRTPVTRSSTRPHSLAAKASSKITGIMREHGVSKTASEEIISAFNDYLLTDLELGDNFY